MQMTRSGHIVTGSADKTVKVFDMKAGLKKPLMQYKCTDAVFCGDVVGERIVTVGTGDGNLLAFDL